MRQKEIEQELRLKVTERVSGEGLTVSELMEEYLKAKSTETRESTLDKSKRILKYHVIPHLGEYKLKKANRTSVAKMENAHQRKRFSRYNTTKYIC